VPQHATISTYSSISSRWASITTSAASCRP
jgi:hypothetical protein